MKNNIIVIASSTHATPHVQIVEYTVTRKLDMKVVIKTKLIETRRGVFLFQTKQ